MDMYNILKNFDDASSGKKPGAATANANEMKAILESFDRATTVEECGMAPGAITTSSPQREGSPVTMNISLNASGKENVDELMALLKGAGIAPTAPSMAAKEPMDMGAMRALVMGPDEPEMDDESEIESEEWDNSPEEQYSDHETMTQDLSGGINRQKKQFKPAAKGDNPMAVESVKDRLWAALSEKKEDYSAKKARAGKDIGKPGKNFAKIAKKAGEKYGSKERGEKVAGAVLAKLRKG